MSQVIRDIPMDANVLKSTMEKWISFNANPETSTELAIDEASSVDINETQDDKNLGQNIPFESIVGIKFNLHLFDEEKEIKESEQDNIKAELRSILSNLVQKYHGENVIEINDITSIKFLYLNKAVQFVYSFLSELNNYKENHGDYNIIIDIKNAILRIPEDKDINLDTYVSDVLEYAYNQDVVVNNAIKDELLDSSYGFEFLGDKPLGRSGMSEALYKMNM